MKKWLCLLLMLLMTAAVLVVRAEEPIRVEYTGGVVMRTMPKTNHAPGCEEINVGYAECNMPYLLLGHETHWTLGIEGGQPPYSISMVLFRRALDATDAYYWSCDSFDLGEQTQFHYTFELPGTYFWQITVTDSWGQRLVFQTRPMATAGEAEELDPMTVAGKVHQIISENITEDMSEYRRALVLHDWLIYNANYDETYSMYDPEGVLLYGKGVCDSYARAYQMLCTAAGLECIYVSGYAGGPHGWNLVKVDGSWYHVDCTWDDPLTGNPNNGGAEHHGYFLLTDEQIGKDHEWNTMDKGEMVVPGTGENEFVGTDTTDCDFTFATIEDCTAAIKKIIEEGNFRQSIVAVYTGNENISSVYNAFGKWMQTELQGLLNKNGSWRSWGASGNRFELSIAWKKQAEYVRFDAEKVYVSVGETKDVVAVDCYPASNAFTFESSDPDVATVMASYNAQDGLVATIVGLSGGKSVITVSGKDGVYDTFEVVVMESLVPDFHLEIEDAGDELRLTWHSIPGVTEYRIMREMNGEEDCLAVVQENHEVTLDKALLPENVRQEIWVVGRRIAGGMVEAEYYGQRQTYGKDDLPVAHAPVADPAQEPTCTVSGWTEGSHCSVCGAILVAQEEIPALGHMEVDDAGCEPTCTEPGLGRGSHCERCGEVVKPREEIPALGHMEVDDAGFEPTCTEPGLGRGSHCERCGEVVNPQEEIPALGHMEIAIPGVPATHATDGLSDGAECGRCGEVLLAQDVLPRVQVQVFSVPDFITDIEAEAFAGCRFECVVVGSSCWNIGASAFANNPALRFVEIPASVKHIDASAFNGCNEELVIVTTAGSAAQTFAGEHGIPCVIR